jgi:hypothetical protein
MQAPVTHLLPLTTIRRERLLPGAGKVVVRAGQKVTAGDIVAQANLDPEHVLLDIARGLGVSPEQADQLVQRKVGDQISKGDVIAGPVGILNRVVRSEGEATIVAIGDGQVLMEMKGSQLDLQAGTPGTVIDLIPDRGVVIETVGALVQGVWGNGKVDKSLLAIAAHTPADILATNQIDVSFRGAVVLGGILTTSEALQTVIDMPLRGLILASMSARLIDQARQAPFPIILTEGFGKIPMNPTAYKLLSTNEQRETTVNAQPWNHYNGSRPEIIIPLPSTGGSTQPPETDIFAPGQSVRIHRAPHAGKTGILTSLRAGQTAFPSGVRTAAGMVRLESGDQVLVPLTNIDVIE